MNDPAIYSTAWYVREAVRGLAPGATFTAANIAGLTPKDADVSDDAAASALSDLMAHDTCLSVARKEGRTFVYEKIADPRPVAKRRRRNVITPAPEPVQQDMPLTSPQQPAPDMGALREHVRASAALLGIAFDIKSASTADLQAELALRWTSRP